jgi:hypothetical protein
MAVTCLLGISKQNAAILWLLSSSSSSSFKSLLETSALAYYILGR